jgi:hypothetical protein
MSVTDPVSRLTFEVSLYRLYRRVKCEVSIAQVVQVIAGEEGRKGRQEKRLVCVSEICLSE